MNRNFTHHNKVELIKNGETFIKRVISEIETAKRSIHLQTYIFEIDDITLPIIKALNHQADKGLKVSILLDSYGSQDFNTNLLNPRVDIRFFSPLLSRGLSSIGRRLHSKVIVFDSNKAIIGGINLSKRFNLPSNQAPWLDYACLLEGEEVSRLCKKLKITKSEGYIDNNCSVKTNVNDWSRFKNEIYKSYINAIKNSKEKIVLVAPYFLPGKKFLKQLKCAADRGVCVELIFSSNSDHPLERWSSKYLYSWLLENNIQIYEWDKSIVHGKIALIDNDWVTIGSFNHNFTSHFGNHEVNIEISDVDFSKDVFKEINFIKKHSVQILKSQWREENIWKHRVYEWLTYTFANLLTLISLILISRRKQNSDINLLE